MQSSARTDWQTETRGRGSKGEALEVFRWRPSSDSREGTRENQPKMQVLRGRHQAGRRGSTATA